MLVVDDKESNRNAALEAAKLSDVDITVADTYTKAIEQLTSGTKLYNAALFDVFMPASTQVANDSLSLLKDNSDFQNKSILGVEGVSNGIKAIEDELDIESPVGLLFGKIAEQRDLVFRLVTSEHGHHRKGSVIHSWAEYCSDQRESRLRKSDNETTEIIVIKTMES